jgi:hypothetical protein
VDGEARRSTTDVAPSTAEVRTAAEMPTTTEMRATMTSAVTTTTVTTTAVTTTAVTATAVTATATFRSGIPSGRQHGRDNNDHDPDIEL